MTSGTMTWEDVDLEHLTVNVHASLDRTKGKTTTTKTETPRRNPIETSLVPLLCGMRKEAGGTGRVAPRMLAKLAPFLGRCLEVAGVTRPELFASTRTQKPLRFYDLRATGIRCMAVRGDDPQVIQRRAGHTTFQTTEGYIREAENLDRSAYGTPFPPLPKSLLGDPDSSPESSSGGKRNAPRPGKPGARRGGGAGNRLELHGVHEVDGVQ